MSTTMGVERWNRTFKSKLGTHRTRTMSHVMILLIEGILPELFRRQVIVK